MNASIAKAVHQLLATNSLIQDNLGTPPRLYDAAPEDPVFPYLSYGNLRSEDIGGDETHLTSHQMTLHLWSRYSGRSEILTLMTVLKQVLADKTGLAVALETGSVISSAVLFTDILRAADGRTHHGLLRLSVLTETT